MKICYVANSRFPSERAHMTQIVQMCNAFAHLGHQVTLLVTDRKTDITETAETFFGTRIDFTVARVAVPDVAGRSPRIPSVLRPYLFFIQRVAFTCRAILHVKQHRYTHLYGRDEWILWLMSLFTDTPIVWESHEARYSFPARRLLAKGVSLVVISEGIRDFYLQKSVAENRVLVAHDAVDARFFEPHVPVRDARRLLGIETTKPVVMYIGGLEDWKGAETLFEASRDQESFLTYVVGGKEREISDMRAKYPHVHFLGSRPYRELPVIQQAADVLVIPNTARIPLSALYTSPLKLFSYMTARKPIVASRVPSITNVLASDDAYFFTPDNPDSLREAIVTAISDTNRSSANAVRAYAKSLRYTWQSRAETILRFSE